MCFPSVLRDIQKLRFLKIVPHTSYLWEIETEELEVKILHMSSKIQKPPPSRFLFVLFQVIYYVEADHQISTFYWTFLIVKDPIKQCHGWLILWSPLRAALTFYQFNACANFF